MKITYVVLHDVPSFLNINVLLVEWHRVVHTILQHRSNFAAHHVTGNTSAELQSEYNQQENRELNKFLSLNIERLLCFRQNK